MRLVFGDSNNSARGLSARTAASSVRRTGSGTETTVTLLFFESLEKTISLFAFIGKYSSGVTTNDSGVVGAAAGTGADGVAASGVWAAGTWSLRSFAKTSSSTEKCHLSSTDALSSASQFLSSVAMTLSSLRH